MNQVYSLLEGVLSHIRSHVPFGSSGLQSLAFCDGELGVWQLRASGFGV